MQLVLRCDRGETLKLDVLPEDTFNDLAERLYNRAKISVDFKQLQTAGRPFLMNANVIEYITSNKKVKENIQSEPSYSDKLNSLELADHSNSLVNEQVEYCESSDMPQNEDSLCVIHNQDSSSIINLDGSIIKSSIPVPDETFFDNFRDEHNINIDEHTEEQNIIRGKYLIY